MKGKEKQKDIYRKERKGKGKDKLKNTKENWKETKNKKYIKEKGK